MKKSRFAFLPRLALATTVVLTLTGIACGPAVEDTGPVESIGERDTKVCPTLPLPEGVDVYDGDGTPDWAAAKADGISFAIMKATQGTYNTQKNFPTNWAAARKAGIVRGAYHFFDPTEDGVAQAKHFLAVVGTIEPDDLPPTIDVECPDGDAVCLGFSGGSGQAPAAEIRTRLDEFLHTIEQAIGRKPIIYTFASYFSGNKIDTTGLDAYPLWLASLTASSGCYTAPSPWTHAAIWQYSFTGTVTGIAGGGSVDRDRIDVPIDTLLGLPVRHRVSKADLDGDHHADVCARNAAGLTCALSNASGFSGFGAEFPGPAWSDTTGWAAPSSFSTIQFGDVDGDGKADACARSTDGVSCVLSTGHGFGASFPGPAWSDAAGWNAPAYGQTIQLGDLDGDGTDDVCGRAVDGIECAKSNGRGFDPIFAGPAWSDATGWAAPEYYATIQLGDVDGDGKDDLCARTPTGIQCARSNGAGFDGPFDGPAWSDAQGWNKPEYYATIQLGDLDGDGKADLCARAAKGITCARSHGDGFDAPFDGPAWGDAEGWNVPDAYATIQLGDLDGDGKADLCGRDASGVTCARSNGAGFDAAGWGAFPYASTIALADVNGDGKDDLCARAAKGITCATSNGTAFDPPFAGPLWSDAQGWNLPEYYRTIRFVGAPKAKASGGDAGPLGDAGSDVDAGEDAGGPAVAAEVKGSCSCETPGDSRRSSVGGVCAIVGLAMMALRRSRRRRG